ncbi:Uncharacterized protein HZ326_28342 [Fusarium oxysporum f. sp. albedinis]|nr:Uncharacterized protein HZ326_28342 [Fusarium oxysporum f. sp. albedinis]
MQCNAGHFSTLHVNEKKCNSAVIIRSRPLDPAQSLVSPPIHSLPTIAHTHSSEASHLLSFTISHVSHILFLFLTS